MRFCVRMSKCTLYQKRKCQLTHACAIQWIVIKHFLARKVLTHVYAISQSSKKSTRLTCILYTSSVLDMLKNKDYIYNLRS